MASETIFGVTASLVLWEGVYEFTPHYSRNKHTIPLITLGERSAVSRRSAQLLNGDRKLFCMIRQQRAAAARSHARLLCVLQPFLWANRVFAACRD